MARDTARRLALQTVVGSARLIEQTGRHPAELRDMVTSPGGDYDSGAAGYGGGRVSGGGGGWGCGGV